MDTKTRQFIGLVLILTLTAQMVCAQSTEKKALTLEAAKRAIDAAASEAKKGAGTGAIAIVDEAGNPMAVERLDNTAAASANISIGKARTAAIFKKPTKGLEETINQDRTATATLSDFTPVQGGIPILIDGQVVGGIGVSGSANVEQDDRIATAGANALRNPVAAATFPVTYVPRQQMEALFARGAPILDTTGRSYRADANRRAGRGQVEIHAKITDLFYIVKGEATFITGGTMVDGKPTAPDEIRGSSITGGEEHTLSPGDCIVVPAGTPHWFKEVKGEIQYFLVKVN